MSIPKSDTTGSLPIGDSLVPNCDTLRSNTAIKKSNADTEGEKREEEGVEEEGAEEEVGEKGAEEDGEEEGSEEDGEEEGSEEDGEEDGSLVGCSDSTTNSNAISLRVDTSRIPTIRTISKAMKLSEQNKANRIQDEEGIQSVLSRLNAGDIVSDSLGPEDNSPPRKQEVVNEPISECLRKYYQFDFVGDKGNWKGSDRNMRRFRTVVAYMVKAAELANYKDLPSLIEKKPPLYCRDNEGEGEWIVSSLYEDWEDNLKKVAFEIQRITKALLLAQEIQKDIKDNVQPRAKADTGSPINTLYAVDKRITALNSKKKTARRSKSPAKKSPVKKIGAIIDPVAQKGSKRKAELNVELVGDNRKKNKSQINVGGDIAVNKKGNNTKVTMNNYFPSSKTSSSSD
jgi:hypothetical protein